jgi:hypothetical protein
MERMEERGRWGGGGLGSERMIFGKRKERGWMVRRR